MDTVKHQFTVEDWVSVHVADDVDSDGDPVLRVSIVLNEDEDDLDPKKMLGLVRHLRSRLARHGEERFPLVSFFSRGDYAKMKREAA